MTNSFRRHLSMPGMPGMPETMRERFDGIPDPIKTRGATLSDCLMSGLAVFSFKTPSLPRFDRNTLGGGDPVAAGNLRSPFGVARAPQQSPSGTRMRGRLDEVGPAPKPRRGIGEPDRARGGHSRWRSTAPGPAITERPGRRSSIRT